MRRLPTFLPVVALALLAAWPLISYGPPTVSDDGPNHFYRFAALDWHVRHGDWYPRWFSDVHFGFGGPVLNYYSPITYYIPVALRLLAPSFPTAFALSFALSVAVAIFGMYLWARAQFGSTVVALTTAAAYGLAPYFFFNLFERVSHPEVWAMAGAPWVFWMVLRLVRGPAPATQVTLTVLYAAFALTHNLSALFFTPALIGYGLIAIWTAPDRPRYKTAILLGLSLFRAIALDAFFLLPFVAEASYVQLSRAGQMFDFHASFPKFGETFSWPIPYDPNHVINIYPASLAWPQLGLAGAVFAAAWVSIRRKKDDAIARTVITIGLVFLGLVALTFPLALPFWETFPLARLTQFVWRVLNPATLLLAWLAGAAIARIPSPTLQKLTALIAVTSFYFFSLSWTYHDQGEPFPSQVTALEVIRHEVENPHLAGTTTSLEFLPRWVKQLPPPDTLLQRYLDDADRIPSRLAPLPSNVTVIAEKTGLKTTELTYDSAEAFTADFYLFYFPGWTATLDGQPLEFQIADPHGSISAPLPAGRHTLHLALLPTPPQIAGTLISTLALISLIAPFLLRRRFAQAAPAPTKVSPTGLAPAWTLLFAGLLGLRVLVLDRYQNIFWRTELDDVAHPLSVNFDNQLELIGFDLPKGDSFASGGSFQVKLYWRATRMLDVSYSTSVHLVDPYGNRFGHSDSYYPAKQPTTLWEPERYARDVHFIDSLSGIPPGEYHLLVSAYHLQADGSSTFLSIREGESPVGIEYDLGLVTVTRAWPQFPGSLRLVEGGLNVETIAVGDYLPLNVLWNSGNSPLPPLTAQLTVTASDGRPLWVTDLPPARPDYPTDQWTRNELVRYPLTVTLPPDLPAGPARVQIQLLAADRSPASEAYDLGDIAITVPDRSFAVPPMDRTVGYDFNGAIRLLGYSITPDSTVLYWQSLQVVSKPLTVFVHRFGAGGAFVAGHDGPPPRITTSWLPGEVVADPHPLVVGDHFEVGLYDSATGERFSEPFVVTP